VLKGLCFGGIARLYTTINEKRSTLPNPIVLNAGDNYQGTLMYSLFKWNITMEFMKRFNFDASVNLPIKKAKYYNLYIFSIYMHARLLETMNLTTKWLASYPS
jgi:hypothetical protein